jgi:GNAT superfamily N-acetyltransferase
MARARTELRSRRSRARSRRRNSRLHAVSKSDQARDVDTTRRSGSHRVNAPNVATESYGLTVRNAARSSPPRAARSRSSTRDVELLRPRLRQGMLVYELEDGGSANEPVPVGVGRYLDLGRAAGAWTVVRRGSELIARPVDGSGSALDHPWRAAQAEISLSTNPWVVATPCGRMRFWVTADDVSYVRARQLLERSHPHRAPNSGIVLCCAFANEDDQIDLRRRMRRQTHEDPWSAAWQEAPGGVVGCLVMSRLFHGNPKGRAAIAADARLPLRVLSRPRNRVVADLGVAWISRIAVDAPYRGNAIGTALVSQALAMAITHAPWFPRYVEVIRTVTTATHTTPNASGSKRDFLQKAGYTAYTSVTPRADPWRPYKVDGSRGDPVPSKQIYYWARLR